MKELIGFPDGSLRDWLVAAGYLVFFATLFVLGGEWQ